MSSLLLESALRSLLLATAVWIGLRLWRARSPGAAFHAWLAALGAAVTMPLAMMVMAAFARRAPQLSMPWIPDIALPIALTPLAMTGSRPESVDWGMVALTVYFIVAGVFAARLLTGLMLGFRVWKNAVPVREPWTAGVRVRTSAQVRGPVTFGRTIVLPADWTQWSVFKRNAVLLHEQAHVRRLDFYTQLLCGAYRAAYWFSPLSWWLRNELVRLSEAACDDAAVEGVEDRVAYAELLIALSANPVSPAVSGVTMASARTVERRVDRLLRETRQFPRASRYRRVAALASFVAALGISAGTTLVDVKAMPELWTKFPAAPDLLGIALSLQQQPQPAAAPSPTQQVPAARPEPQGLARWIDEEVPDITAPEEADAFRRLSADEERERFIESFWLRRDPTPGTADNEFRNEYYRRIVLANEKFTSGIPGWKTDRGRILIKFGEPDEIETHALGGTYIRLQGGGATRTVTLPFERWLYRFIEGIGRNAVLEFVDADVNGNYTLVPTANGGTTRPLQ